MDVTQDSSGPLAVVPRSLFRDYREFLLTPGTIFTLVSSILLAIAVLYQVSGLFIDAAPEAYADRIYLAAALVGSSFIWYSAVQGIREGDFTADIPVSLATAAESRSGSTPPPPSSPYSFFSAGCLKNSLPPVPIGRLMRWPGCCPTG